MKIRQHRRSYPRWRGQYIVGGNYELSRAIGIGK
jgi:hypothetical protein